MMNLIKNNTCTLFILLAMLMSINTYGEEIEPLPIGAKAPDFSLKATDGKMYSLSDFEDADILVLIFTANHCPTAQAYEQRMIQLVNDYKDKGVKVVAVSPNSPKALCLEEQGYSNLGDDFEDMVKRAENQKFNFIYLYDGDSHEMSKAYGPATTPHVYIFDKDRVLRFRGRIDDMENPYKAPTSRDTRAALDALLSGKPVPVETTKTFGCSVKWASKADWRKKLDDDWKNKPVTLKNAGLDELKNVLINNTGNYRVINFWATWCGPCVIEFPDLINLQRIYGGRNFEFVTFSLDEPSKETKVLQFLKDKNAATSNYIYTGENKYKLLEAVDDKWSGSIPFTILIAPGGEILYQNQGIVDVLELRTEIVKHLGRFFADN